MIEGFPIRGRIAAIFAVVLVLSLCGCAAHRPYTYGATYSDAGIPLGEDESQVEFGQKMPVLDVVGWIVGIPNKIILFDHRVDNHHVGDGTAEAIAEYLAANDLTTKVRVNQYAPWEDWRRLQRNTAVGWPARYTLGTLSIAGEAIFVGRFWGGDHYNPFSDTIHVYSDIPAVALHEGGHAKDFANRYYKGWYAVAYLLPVVPLWHEGVATRDAMSYMEDQGQTEEKVEGYHVLYPAYGTYLGSAFGHPYAWILAGHAVGRVEGWRYRRRNVANETHGEVVEEEHATSP